MLGAGAYFGETALLRDAPRNADVVVAANGATLLKLTREHFDRRLGPLRSVLAKESDRREKALGEALCGNQGL